MTGSVRWCSRWIRLRHMVSISDNTASDALLALAGGPHAVTTRMAKLGSRAIRVDRSERQIAADLAKECGVERYAIDARDTFTPDAIAELLVAFWNRRDGLSPESHDLLVHPEIHRNTGNLGRSCLAAGGDATRCGTTGLLARRAGGATRRTRLLGTRRSARVAVLGRARA